MRVRRADLHDLLRVRNVRLRALAEAPEAFDGILAEEAERTGSGWLEFMAQGALFLLEAGHGPNGMAIGVPHHAQPLARFLVSVWVDPVLRGTGAADRLVTGVLGWAEMDGATAIFLHAGARNLRARRFYERLGFRATGQAVQRMRDLEVELEMVRALGAGRPPS